MDSTEAPAHASSVSVEQVEAPLIAAEPLWPALAALAFFSIAGTLLRLALRLLSGYVGSDILTLVWVQIVGCAIMGAALAFKPAISAASSVLYVGLTTGLAGSVTTFSSWQLQILQLFFRIQPQAKAMYSVFGGIWAGWTDIVVTVMAAICAIWFGGHVATLVEALTSAWWPSVSALFKPFRGGWSLWNWLVCVLAAASWAAMLALASADTKSQPFAMAAVFGPLGTVLRWRLARLNLTLPHFPRGTFAANMLGTAILAVLYVLGSGVQGCWASLLALAWTSTLQAAALCRAPLQTLALVAHSVSRASSAPHQAREPRAKHYGSIAGPGCTRGLRYSQPLVQARSLHKSRFAAHLMYPVVFLLPGEFARPAPLTESTGVAQGSAERAKHGITHIKQPLFMCHGSRGWVGGNLGSVLSHGRFEALALLSTPSLCDRHGAG